MNAVEFRNVVKSFDGVKVLDGVSFEVKKGEIFAIVGPSGTGKSVSLKHIASLLQPDSGEVWVSSGKIGYLFQSGALLAWMTLKENVALPLIETTSLSDEEISSRVSSALEAVGLSDAAEKYPSEISGGMQKRAGLARSIVRDVSIVLYDEPTSGLDPVTSATINDLIVRLNRERGITSIVVTHDLASALKFADTICLIEGGRVAQCSTPEDFVKSENPVVREFLAAIKGEIL
jgi:phospholipid/cholesterol/gamma-HCH transport system ATP-binding protein